MQLSQRIYQAQTLTISPQMIQANRILQMSALQLRQEIQLELSENPALELHEVTLCPRCNAVMREGICEQCGLQIQSMEDRIENIDNMVDLALSHHDEENRLYQVEDMKDAFFGTAARLSLKEHLLRELSLQIDEPNLLNAAELLVINLDERGYLRYPLEQLAGELGFDLEFGERALAAVQAQEPAGVGARDARECLLIQIRALKNEGLEVNPAAETLIRDYFAKLGKGDVKALSRTLDVKPAEIEKALAFIRDHLEPFPIRAYSEGLADEEEMAPIRPNAIIYREGDEFTVEIVETGRSMLRVNRAYVELYEQMKHGKGDFPEEEREHVRKYFERARLFMRNIHSRRQTLKRITETIIQVQKPFFLQGLKHMKKLTRSDIAGELGIHESTVSRATASKYVQIPSGEVLSYDVFFDTSIAIKEYIRNFVAQEDPAHPLSDAALAEMLARGGIKVARRTVAKYREEMNILSSHLRKASTRIENAAHSRGAGSKT